MAPPPDEAAVPKRRRITDGIGRPVSSSGAGTVNDNGNNNDLEQLGQAFTADEDTSSKLDVALIAVGMDDGCIMQDMECIDGAAQDVGAVNMAVEEAQDFPDEGTGPADVQLFAGDEDAGNDNIDLDVNPEPPGDSGSDGDSDDSGGGCQRGH